MTPSDPSTATPSNTAPIPPASRGQKATVGAVFLLILVGYLASVPGVWLIHSDSAVYIVLGESLAEGKGYLFNGEPCIKYPPVYPLMLAPVHAMFGQNMTAIQSVGALSGVVALWVFYVLLRMRLPCPTALALTVLAATSTWFQSYAAACATSGVPYAMFSLLAVWYAERQLRSIGFSWLRWACAALLVVVAMYAHLIGVSLVAAIGAAVLVVREPGWNSRRRLTAAAIVGIVGCSAAGFWVTRSVREGPGAGYENLVRKEPVEVLEDPLPKLAMRAKEWAATPFGLDPEDYPQAQGVALFALLLVPGLACAIRRYRGVPEFYLVAYFLVMYFHGGMGGKERYVVPVVPLLFYYGYLSVLAWGRWTARLLGRYGGAFRTGRLRWLPRAVLIAGLVGITGAALYQRRRSRGGARCFHEDRIARAQRWNGRWEQMAEFVQRHLSPNGLIFPSPGGDNALIHYFTRHPVGRLRLRQRGISILRSMLDQNAELAVGVRHERTFAGLIAAIETYPECFEKIYAEHAFMAYRIHRSTLRETVARMQAGPSSDAPTAPRSADLPERGSGI